MELDFCLKLPEKVKRFAKKVILKGEDEGLEYSFVIHSDFSTSEVFAGQPHGVQLPLGALRDCLASFHTHHSIDGIWVDETFSLDDILANIEHGCTYTCIGFVRDGKPYLRCLKVPEDPKSFGRLIDEKAVTEWGMHRTFREVAELFEKSETDYTGRISHEELLRWVVENKPKEAERIVRKLKNYLREDRLVEERYAQVCEIPL